MGVGCGMGNEEYLKKQGSWKTNNVTAADDNSMLVFNLHP